MLFLLEGPVDENVINVFIEGGIYWDRWMAFWKCFWLQKCNCCLVTVIIIGIKWVIFNGLSPEAGASFMRLWCFVSVIRKQVTKCNLWEVPGCACNDNLQWTSAEMKWTSDRDNRRWRFRKESLGSSQRISGTSQGERTMAGTAQTFSQLSELSWFGECWFFTA